MNTTYTISSIFILSREHLPTNKIVIEIHVYQFQTKKIRKKKQFSFDGEIKYKNVRFFVQLFKKNKKEMLNLREKKNTYKNV